MSPNSQQIGISGIGVLSPLGAGAAQHRDALKQDRRPETFAITDFNARQYIKRRYLRPLDQVTVHCIAMAAEAMRDAQLDSDTLNPERVGVVIGSMYAGIGCIFDFKQACHEAQAENYLGLSPLHFPGIVFNSLSGQPAIEFGFTGPNSVINAGFSSGLLAIIKGAETIRAGQADVVIAGGAEMTHPYLHEKYQVRRADRRLNSLAADFQLSEAVCLFVLHRVDDSRFPAAHRYASLNGWSYGFQADGYAGDGLSKAMHRALDGSDRSITRVVTSTDPHDPLHEHESRALHRALAGSALRLLHNQRHFGRTLGASGSLNLLHCLLDPALGDAEEDALALVNSLDPNGSFALLTLRRENRHD